jgi:hypothetical protein
MAACTIRPVSQLPRSATSTAVPLTLRSNAAPTGVAPLVMRRSGLRFDAVHTATCPACGVRPTVQVERFTLRGQKRVVDIAERLLGPPSVVAVAVLSGLWMDTVWWPFILVFGPTAALSVAAATRLALSPRYRLKVALCPSCAASIRAARRKTRLARLFKNATAWGMVMLAPMVITPMFGDQLSLVGTVTAALALACSAGHWTERLWRRRADAQLPSPVHVSADEVRLLPPASWMPVLTAEAPALLQLPPG